ncbi:hypothetical protein POM88_021013 [Heracleum sosnowskyi]|uniref:Cytochrome P450 n=1 Tax=Heracleum sosnowskyi TaxID=360622 RepID=A0AAD8IF44_9APIA|nr:hypothetical protein POM88_021013 [Heracleum sosnowskyi]
MSLGMGSVPARVVSSPEAAQLFLKTHDSVFAARPQMEAVTHMSYGNNGISLTNGTYWRHVRKFVVQELLAPAKVNSFRGMRRDEVGLVVEEIKKAAVACEEVNVSDKVGGLIENMTFRFLLGRSKDDKLIDRPSIKSIMIDIITEAIDTSFSSIEWILTELMRHPIKRNEKVSRGANLRALLDLIEWWRRRICPN